MTHKQQADDSTAQVGEQNTERLQRAAQEMINAARSFLDIAEEFVNDPSKVADAAATVSGLVSEGLKLGSDLIGQQMGSHDDAFLAQHPGWRDDPLATDPIIDDDRDLSDDPFFGDHPSKEPSEPEAESSKRAPAPVKKSATKKAATTTTATKKPAARKTPVKKSPAKKTPTKKSPAATRPVKKTSTPTTSSPKVRRIPLDD